MGDFVHTDIIVRAMGMTGSIENSNFWKAWNRATTILPNHTSSFIRSNNGWQTFYISTHGCKMGHGEDEVQDKIRKDFIEEFKDHVNMIVVYDPIDGDPYVEDISDPDDDPYERAMKRADKIRDLQNEIMRLEREEMTEHKT